MKNKITKLDFSKSPRIEFTHGTKTAIVLESYRRTGRRGSANEKCIRIINISYYDTRYDEISHTKFSCCKPISECKSEKGAIKMINKFFTEK